MQLFAERMRISSYHLNFRERERETRICPLFLSEFIVSETKVGPIFLVALIAHYTLILTSFNGTAWVS
jgi:hypothetical protein